MIVRLTWRQPVRPRDWEQCFEFLDVECSTAQLAEAHEAYARKGGVTYDVDAFVAFIQKRGLSVRREVELPF